MWLLYYVMMGTSGLKLKEGGRSMKKAVKVLEALMYGNITVKMDGHELVYSREHEGVFIKGEKFEHGQPMEQGKGTPVLLNADFDLNYFIRKCEEMPDHEILGICGSLALTKAVHKKRRGVGDE
ncbi:hypothetical protein JL_44 [Bacillus phage JL]|uniref:Uncharacterized protein n=1 Tax=Bacillus phage JL TaxID=1296655 RepID=S5M8C1_9CAUD|nr:hypothetical protein AVV47_gp044 [Bacillus phage JL]AGR46733.1 hypothetical protein JL_44 [Bacillus phage JL]